MTAAIRALLTDVIDYAGLFPPAALSLDDSIQNYAKYLGSDYRWMLGKFICPAAKLAQLQPYVNELFSTGEPLRISALGRGGNTDVEFNAAVEADFHDMARFVEAAGGRATVDAYEAKLPALGATTLPGASRDIYLEPAAGADWLHSMKFIASMRSIGLKLRTGGVEASAFPTVDQVALTIGRCARREDKRMKFTAGLHHPIRHFNESVNTKMHGFINVFVAGVLAHALQLDEAALVQILSDEDPASFRFSDDGLRYKDFAATIDQIKSARQRVISFGSCSFDEPREDLRALGWL